MKKIEAVIVCLNYSDFLSHTLPYNKNFFEKTVVVTDTKDLDTKRVCEFWNVQCIQTDDFYIDNPKIPNKSRGINKGLEYLKKDGWVLQLDADIWLPNQTRTILFGCELDDKCIYGIDRLMCESFKDWYKFIHTSQGIYGGWIYLYTEIFPIGTRIVQYYGEGYQPIGFFQLWNPKGSGIYDYPSIDSGFDRTDVVHLKRWERKYRRFIPDMLCVHLSNQGHEQGQNWSGRKTRKFGPEKEYTWITKLLRKVYYGILKFFYKKFNYISTYHK